MIAVDTNVVVRFLVEDDVVTIDRSLRQRSGSLADAIPEIAP